MTEGNNDTICTEFLEINKQSIVWSEILFELMLISQQMSKDGNETHSVFEKITLFCFYFYNTRVTQCSFVEISSMQIGERL
jgi:hypothetical protein